MSAPLFTDLYQWTMAYSYFKNDKAFAPAVFEVFFRSCPFGGEYAIMAGHDRLREVLENFRLEEQDWKFLQSLPVFKNLSVREIEAHFDLSDLNVRAAAEGEAIFARTPILQVSGPLFKAQLLESIVLNALNFPILCATYARRIRQVAGSRKLIEFGMRRAQGPDGAMTASRSSYLGGFDGSSNVLAGKKWQIPVYGTMAHSYVQSFETWDDSLLSWNHRSAQDLFLKHQESTQTHRGELAAFMAYARSYPDHCLLLIDTYDSMGSGILNAIHVFKILRDLGHRPLGIRLDSGDLVYQSQQARRLLNSAGFKDVSIFASNDLSEGIIASLQTQGSEIDAYGIGTHLVTCKDQPALGAVYKLVELNSHPRLKISEQTSKISIPAAKNVYRLIGKDGRALLDLLQHRQEEAPRAGEALWALHPFDPFKKAQVTPSQVRPLLTEVFKNGEWISPIDLEGARRKSLRSLEELRPDILRRENPTPHKVSLSQELRRTLEDSLQREAPAKHLE